MAPFDSSDEAQLCIAKCTVPKSALRSEIMLLEKFEHAEMIKLHEKYRMNSSLGEISAVEEPRDVVASLSQVQTYDWMETWTETQVEEICSTQVESADSEALTLTGGCEIVICSEPSTDGNESSNDLTNTLTRNLVGIGEETLAEETQIDELRKEMPLILAPGLENQSEQPWSINQQSQPDSNKDKEPLSQENLFSGPEKDESQIMDMVDTQKIKEEETLHESIEVFVDGPTQILRSVRFSAPDSTQIATRGDSSEDVVAIDDEDHAASQGAGSMHFLE